MLKFSILSFWTKNVPNWTISYWYTPFCSEELLIRTLHNNIFHLHSASGKAGHVSTEQGAAKHAGYLICSGHGLEVVFMSPENDLIHLDVYIHTTILKCLHIQKKKLNALRWPNSHGWHISYNWKQQIKTCVRSQVRSDWTDS